MFLMMKWTNWSANESAQLERMERPTSIEEVVQAIQQAREEGKAIRTVGASHSFSPVARPDSIGMTLDGLRGIVSVNEAQQEVTLWAGTYLYEAAPALAQHGFAFENMGDIQAQTVAGAVSTGTHGTGIAFGSLASQVVAWQWVDGLGQVHTHRRGEDDLSEAMHVSLGLLGVLVQLTFRVVPLYSLEVRTYREPIETVLENYQEQIERHRHVEWFYFPGTDLIQVKESNTIPLIAQTKTDKWRHQLKESVIETAGFKLLSEACRKRPSLSHRVIQFSAEHIPVGVNKGYYYEMFPSARKVKFTEVEYAVDLQDVEAIIREIRAYFATRPFYVHFPIEIRTSAGEAGFLSPTQGRPTAYFAFHMYQGMSYEAYFDWVHELMKAYEGRAHFGKMNAHTIETVQALYPNWSSFNEIRQHYDPDDVFVTSGVRLLTN